MRRAALGLAVALLVCLAGGSGAADLRRVQSVGVVPIGEGAPDKAPEKTATPRTLAVRAAVARAVESTAQSLGPSVPRAPADAAPADPTAIAPQLAAALGTDPLDYATSYRVVEDRGRRAALFARETGATSEYVVLVEVQVDADRVADRLRAAGWLAPKASGGGEHLRLVLEGVSDYRAYDAVRRLLVERAGARSAQPVEFARGRVVLAVEGAQPPQALTAALQAAAPPELRLAPVETTADGLTLLVEWTPQAPAATAPAPPPSEAPTAKTRAAD